MKATIIITTIIMTLWLAPTASAQEGTQVVDSLRRALYATSDNKEKAKTCIKIGVEAYEPDTVIKYPQMALKLMDLLDLEGMAECYSSQAWAYFIKRDFNQSCDRYQRAAALFERINRSNMTPHSFLSIPDTGMTLDFFGW